MSPLGLALILRLAVALQPLAQTEQAIHIRVASRSEHFTGGVPGGVGAPSPQAGHSQPTPLPERTEFTVACLVPDCPDGVQLLITSVIASPKPRLLARDFEPVLSWLALSSPEELRNALATPSAKFMFDKLLSFGPGREAMDAARRDRSSLERLLTDYYRSVSDHDSVFVDVTLRLAGGREVDASSSSEHAFMIPWRIREGSSAYETYEPEIGRALATLAPRPFAETERLSGRGLRGELVGLLISQLYHATRLDSPQVRNP